MQRSTLDWPIEGIVRLDIGKGSLLGKMLDSPNKTVLLELMMEKKGKFSVSGLSRLSGISKASVSRVVVDWESAGLVECIVEGRNKMISMNNHFLPIPALRRLLGKLRDFHRPVIVLLRRCSTVKSRRTKAVIVFGSRARDDFTSKSDFDVLFVVADKEKMESLIMEEMVALSQRLGIRVSPVVLSEGDVSGRMREKDKFISNILSEGKIIKGGGFIGKLQRASQSRR